LVFEQVLGMHFSAWRLAAGLTFRFLIQHSADVWKMQALLEEVTKYQVQSVITLSTTLGADGQGFANPLSSSQAYNKIPSTSRLPLCNRITEPDQCVSI
jgi:hypothetical protein